MSQKEELEKRILETYTIITQYEEKLRLSDDPREKVRARRDIEEEIRTITEQLTQYFRLSRVDDASKDIIDIALLLDIAIPNRIEEQAPFSSAQSEQTPPEFGTGKKDPSPCAELTILLSHHKENQYNVDMSFRLPDSNASNNPMPSSPVLVQFDMDRLRGLTSDAQAYGTLLTSSLFQQPAALMGFDRARTSAQSQSVSVPLRVRLDIAFDARELHALSWETLRDPVDTTQPLIAVQTFFSRYAASNTTRQVRLRRQKEISALVVIANPPYLQTSDFAPIDVDRELNVVSEGLGTIKMKALTASGESNLETIRNHLRQESYDMLYLVAHGFIKEKKSYLLLDSPDGVPVTGEQFVRRVVNIEQPPPLVVLASCQSATFRAGTAANDGETTLPFTSIGPLLAEVGVPAVIAMQGSISQETSRQFMQSFFHELQRHGIIDQAITEARLTVMQHRPDWWMPALFMRLENGCLWEQ